MRAAAAAAGIAAAIAVKEVGEWALAAPGAMDQRSLRWIAILTAAACLPGAMRGDRPSLGAAACSIGALAVIMTIA